MKLNKLKLMLLGISFAFASPSCVTPPNACPAVKLTERSGICFRTITNEEFIIDDVNLHPDTKETWVDFAETAIYMSPGDYADIKKYILKSCKLSKKCWTKENVAMIEEMFQAFEYKIKKVNPTFIDQAVDHGL